MEDRSMLSRRFLILGATSLMSGSLTFVTFRRNGEAQAEEIFKVRHTDAEWHNLLNPAQYAVLRQEATERP